MARKPTRKGLIKKLDGLCREITRLRDNNACQYCGKYVTGSESQPSHVIPKGNGASRRRFDLLNIKTLCLAHHVPWWHNNPSESGPWFAEKFPARNAYLDIYRGGKPAPIKTSEMRELVETLTIKLAELKGETK